MKKLLATYGKTMWLAAALLLLQEIQAQTDTVKKDSGVDWIDAITSRVTPYGSLRIGAGFAEEGEIGISNNAPRIGIKVKHALSPNEADNFNVIGGIEFGLNLVSRDETVEFAVDPGAGIAQVGDAVFARLGYAGFSYKDLEFTFGKQNSVYYQLGANQVDKFSAFGGAAIGVWNISDGGVSGTGRANQLLKVSYANSGLKIGVQGQARNISVNSKSLDTYGLGASYTIGGFAVGLGYNKVLDGVEDPLPNQAKDGDEAFVTSASYEKDRFSVAASYANLKQHQRLGDTFYDATGIEFYLGYIFSKNKRWKAATGFNYLTPDSEAGLGDFNNAFAIGEVSYAFKKGSKLFAAAKIDQSEDTTGDRRNQSVFGIGVKFDF
ncbi:porin [Ulvibacterium marinum]|uniref:Porin n=1 Tax=Ulvibacterium marinum TaxID=2419782 RepID=A0A3B0CBD4_9FLAO|nr:porin [Ulvibacterium marinum]RKN81379.1 porin [Ulvibacterium marinum]